ncbi:5503_t:CDS:2 [Acaulospora colombiana]|uniref:5503_t:CDS:1 n=1 Tax=Acaulospora colombiana TaxID=27376 RepID=A0ACA9MMI7_9GLOM|nr:5503_t:CDS:2 [Acaulospora colombiana]
MRAIDNGAWYITSSCPMYEAIRAVYTLVNAPAEIGHLFQGLAKDQEVISVRVRPEIPRLAYLAKMSGGAKAFMSRKSKRLVHRSSGQVITGESLDSNCPLIALPKQELHILG